MPVVSIDTALATPQAIRAAARGGTLRGHTAALTPAYAQATLVVLPADVAGDFKTFCERNPKPCPVLDVTEPGSPEPVKIAPGADIRTDIPRYRVYRDGVLAEERDDLLDLWRDGHSSNVVRDSAACDLPARGGISSRLVARRATPSWGPFSPG